YGGRSRLMCNRGRGLVWRKFCTQRRLAGCECIRCRGVGCFLFPVGIPITTVGLGERYRLGGLLHN
ncbi:hypothetical protein FOZ62_001355, partial [Perkinsus olseni]